MPGLARASFLQDLLQSIADRGRQLIDFRASEGLGRNTVPSLVQLAGALLSNRGEASGVALAEEIMRRYAALDQAGKAAFLTELSQRYTPDPEAVRRAFRNFDVAPSPATLEALSAAVESPRQEIIRRLNQAPGNTLNLVRMREDVLALLSELPDLASLDSDFVHLFSSWFNRGFLVMKRIDWTTPAHVLEKIIRYEAVHAIESWDDLRRRLQPADRRCFAFFHPALADEPLIFVEVALMPDMPSAIGAVLASERAITEPKDFKTAVFYSISNCQKGLQKISFGHFLIKQVAEELKREFAGLSRFVTLSPVPGFRRWLDEQPADAEIAAIRARTALSPDSASSPALTSALARYFLEAKTASGQPVDPVARFHLGNGARLERLNPAADLSTKGWRESYGAMVNYLYDLDRVEENHEVFASQGKIIAAPAIKAML
jgi:malonyl-CoA decarboxylase